MNVDTIPIACVPAALSLRERQQARRLRQQLGEATLATHGLPNGYAFVLDGAAGFESAAAWIALERRCCPFLAFGLEWGQADAKPRLTIVGPAGTKDFLRAEMPELPQERSGD